MQNGRAFKRWLYRGQKPGMIAKVLDGRLANAASRNAMSNGLVASEVIGRKSGRVVAFPLVMVSVDGERYLASMIGEDAQWVHNVRASGGNAVLRNGNREDVQPEEIPADQRAPFLKAYLQTAPGAQLHIPVYKNASLGEFEKIAARFPVFRLVSVKTGEQKQMHGI